jgi:hypothetical protein
VDSVPRDGASREADRIATFPLQINASVVYMELPPADVLAARSRAMQDHCGLEAAE